MCEIKPFHAKRILLCATMPTERMKVISEISLESSSPATFEGSRDLFW